MLMLSKFRLGALLLLPLLLSSSLLSSPPLSSVAPQQLELLQKSCMAKDVKIKTLEKQLAQTTSNFDTVKKMHIGAVEKLRNQLDGVIEQNKVMAAKLLQHKGMYYYFV